VVPQAIAAAEHPDIAFYQNRRITDPRRDYGFDARVGAFLRAQIAGLGRRRAIRFRLGGGGPQLFRGGSHTCYGGEEVRAPDDPSRITALHGAFHHTEEARPSRDG
jgi:hypothetical protein